MKSRVVECERCFRFNCVCPICDRCGLVHEGPTSTCLVCMDDEEFDN